MPKVRSPRGARSRFSPARIMAVVTKAYAQAFAGKTPHWRKDIQEHAQRIIVAMGKAHGDHADSDWPRLAIASAVEEELRLRAPTDVHEAYLDQHPERRPRTATGWGKFEPQPSSVEEDDPIWAIARTGREVEHAPSATLSMEHLGDAARTGRAKKTGAAKVVPISVLRSHWLGFWRQEAKRATRPFDLEAFERVVLSIPADQKILDAEHWWLWWQDIFLRALDEDPRLIWLWRVALERHEAARVGGQVWLEGSTLPGFEGGRLVLDDSMQGQALYRRLWMEHMRKWLLDPQCDQRMGKFDIEALALKMAPKRDQRVDWTGWTQMASSDGLWPILPRVWVAHVGMPHMDAREFPQWAWMRLSMSLSLAEADPMLAAGNFYEALSRLEVVPSETLLREAGRRDPQFCEDRAAIVRDEFGDIQDKIHLAAVATKWTGTVALDWARVRAQGSPIAGRRISQGVVGFLRAIHMALAAQGREGDDRPVTVSLPIWHRDIEAFLDLRLRDTDRLQVVVTIPDLFFNRLQKGGEWHLLDPGVFEGLADDFEPNYLKAEDELRTQLRTLPACGKTISAERLWMRLTRAMSQGSPFLTMEGPLKASETFLEAQATAGVDGVGGFPIAKEDPEQATQWPAMVVNLARCLDENGTPDPDRIMKAAAIALRMLDNALILSPAEKDSSAALFRPVCLGLVGYYEAILRATDTAGDDPRLVDSWVRSLAEIWAAAVLRADAQLVAERGPAPAYVQGLAEGFDPIGRHKRLAAAREGSVGMALKPTRDWSSVPTQHRFAARTLWAPFLGPARVAGATPGGLGTLRVEEVVRDERGQLLRLPSMFWLTLAGHYPDEIEELREAFRHPQSSDKWPARVRALVEPDAQGWEQRLKHAAMIAPWLDQGVSLTMSAGIERELLGRLIAKAWWLGLSNIRFDGGKST